MLKKLSFTNGLPELLVLQLLSREEMYGYQLVGEIRARSQDAFNFGEGCIYPILHRLVAKGLISERREVFAGRARVYYRTTAKGKKERESLLNNWNNVVTGAQRVMGVQYA